MKKNGVSPSVYDHSANARFHSVSGAREALRTIFQDDFPAKVLDLGCGTGTWLVACAELGAVEMLGIEVVDVPQGDLLIPKNQVLHADLCRPIDLKRRFDLVLCLETAEHLDPKCADTVADTITRHGDHILFSAAAPGQPGTNHVNCRWPAYWQSLFNARGYVCDDSVRWAIWDNDAIEPWYRQNLMTVTRDEARAGQERRIEAVVHPAMLPVNAWEYIHHNVEAIEKGALPWSWYPTALLKAAAAKVRRRVKHRQ
jgi:SAM-dependent methyltransferase